ncbi:DMT family transporter [Roseovarius sp.]|uniref:DMT family transporter n=1 Tax=Roseovarius sp. TaxID=1486281 RepID=UPI003D1084FF
MAHTMNMEQGGSKVLMGTLLAWLAVLIYASSNSIVTLLTEVGEVNQVMGRNAITFCNLLALGSLISLIPMVFLFHKDWTRDNLRALTRKDWGVLTLSALLSSALTPALFFYALDHTTVTNVVLVGRIEPPLFILAAWLFLKEDFDPWSLAGGLVALVGAALVVALKGDGSSFSLGMGELAAVAATLSFIASTLVTRAGLKGVPLGIFSIYRTILGTIIYAAIALYLYGPLHFQDLLAPVVLKWIWVYAIIVVIIGQLAWNIGLKYARSGDVALATSFSPLAAIVIAMILLGENPGAGLIPGGAVIIAGVALAQYGRFRKKQAEKRAMERAMELEGSANFKGV